MITIWDEVLLKIIVYFDGLVTSKEVFSESSHHIETHLDVVVEVLEIHRSVVLKFCLDEELMKFW